MLLDEPDIALALASPLFFEAETILLFLILVHEILAAHQRGMDVIEGVVDEERPFAVRLDEFPCLGG